MSYQTKIRYLFSCNPEEAIQAFKEFMGSDEDEAREVFNYLFDREGILTFRQTNRLDHDMMGLMMDRNLQTTIGELRMLQGTFRRCMAEDPEYIRLKAAFATQFARVCHVTSLSNALCALKVDRSELPQGSASPAEIAMAMIDIMCARESPRVAITRLHVVAEQEVPGYAKQIRKSGQALVDWMDS